MPKTKRKQKPKTAMKQKPNPIKAVRGALGESQTEFAARFEVNQSTVQRWESKGLPHKGPPRLVFNQLLSVIRDLKKPINAREDA